VAQAGGDAFYLELLAKNGVRTARPNAADSNDDEVLR
jgi:hypothetical protein